MGKSNQFIDMTGKVYGLWTVLRRYDALKWTARREGPRAREEPRG